MFASHPRLLLLGLKGQSLPASASAWLSSDQDPALCCKTMSASPSTFLIRLCPLTPSWAPDFNSRASLRELTDERLDGLCRDSANAGEWIGGWQTEGGMDEWP